MNELVERLPGEKRWLREHYSGKGERHYQVGQGSGVHGLWFISIGGLAPPDLTKGYRISGRFNAVHHKSERGSYRFWLAKYGRKSYRHNHFYRGIYETRCWISSGGYRYNIGTW